MPPLQDLTGLPFGRLRVLCRAPNAPDGKTRWHCQCLCGITTIVYGSHLKGGHTQSCGCWHIEQMSTLHSRHRLTRSSEYQIWSQMRGRCHNRKNPAFHNYGGRGITVCDRWQASFAAFYADMGPRPTSQHTLERIDNALGYNPTNCQWRTRQEQARNTRRNVMVTIEGQTACLKDWFAILGVSKGTYEGRRRRGWPLEKALLTPIAR